MMLTPCCPKAEPTGGAGVAFPACNWSLRTARIFLANLQPLHLEEVQLHRRLPSQEGDQHLDLALLQVDLVHTADEVDEGAVGDADALADDAAHLDARLLSPHLAEDGLDLRLLQGRRLVGRAPKAGDAGRGPDHVPRPFLHA